MTDPEARTRPGNERRTLGMLLVLASAAFFSLTGVLTKSIHADAWTILAWRGFVGGSIVLAYVVALQRREGAGLDLGLGRKGWAIALVSAAASVLFISAFKLTSVASVVIIYATVPFIAAAIGFAVFRSPLVARTLLASAAALGGVTLTVVGAAGASTAFGDGLAVLMTVLCAVYLVMVRAFPKAPSVWAGGVSSFLLIVPGAMLGDFRGVTGQDALLMTLFGASFAAAIVLWTEGAKLIPAAEAGLLGSAEIPIALVLAWLIAGERQTLWALAGGLIVVAAVSLHALADLRETRQGDGENSPGSAPLTPASTLRR